MYGQPLPLALHGILAILLCVAVVTDLKSRIIDNWLTATIALLAPVLWVAIGMPIWTDVAIQLGLGLLVFCLFAGIFALGGMGGGDVKLLGALALWFPIIPMMQLLLIMSLAGGVLTVIMFIRHKWTKADGKIQVPYGVAISFAGLWSIYERYLNHFG